MSSVKEWMKKGAGGLLVLIPALALAMPAFANYAPPVLADTQEPGSVIVFPKFAQGSVWAYAGTGGAFKAAKSVIEVGFVCPIGVGCTFGQKVNVHFHWVCPPAAGSTVCTENDFIISGSVEPNPFGGGDKLTFNAGDNGQQVPGEINGTAKTLAGLPIPVAPCQRGYLIGWVVNNVDQPIRFDALVGDVIARNTPTDLQSASAYTIQAVGPSDGGAITLDGSGALVFDGLGNDYTAVTGQLTSDVRYDSLITAPFGQGFLVFLTLDVKSEQANTATEVQLDFYSHESLLSTSWAFTCWGQVQLSAIDPNLTFENMGGSKGLVVSHQAIDSGTGNQRTMLGLFQATEGPASGPAAATESYTVRPSNNSVPIPTKFQPSF